MKKLLEMLGLKPEATEDEAVATLTVLSNKAEHTHGPASVPAEVIGALGLKEGASLSEITGTILALKQPGNAVSVQEFQALKTRLAKMSELEVLTTLAGVQGSTELREVPAPTGG